MSKAKQHILCASCGKAEWHDHCIVCDEDLGEFNSHHAITVTIGRQNGGPGRTEYVCSMGHLKEYVSGLTEKDLE